MARRSERFNLDMEVKNEEGEENKEKSSDVELVGEVNVGVGAGVGVGGVASSESEWIVISKFRDCEPMRIARIARGSEANPSLRATSGDWSTNECYSKE